MTPGAVEAMHVAEAIISPVISPLPRIPLSGTCDANGNLTVKNQLAAPSGQWCLVYLAVQVSVGIPSWSVLLAGASSEPLIFGSGQTTILGPFLMLPGERGSVVVSAAGPNAIMTGQALGWQAEDPSELPPTTPISTALTSPQQVANAVQTTSAIIGQFPGGQPGTYVFPFTNNQQRGVAVHTYSVVGTGTVTVTIQNMLSGAPGGSTSLDQLSSLALSAGQESWMVLYPGIAAAANNAVNAPLYPNFNIKVVVAGANMGWFFDQALLS